MVVGSSDTDLHAFLGKAWGIQLEAKGAANTLWLARCEREVSIPHFVGCEEEETCACSLVASVGGVARGVVVTVQGRSTA